MGNLSQYELAMLCCLASLFSLLKTLLLSIELKVSVWTYILKHCYHKYEENVQRILKLTGVKLLHTILYCTLIYYS